MNGMKSFGDPNRFEISGRWIKDPEARDRRPKAYGWSMGELCIKVGGINLTEHHLHGELKEAAQWYLGPVAFWLLSQWKWLMHEEVYTWPSLRGESAALTVEADLERYMASDYPKDREVYKEIRAWWLRHALRSADSSALYPSIVIRRVEDSVEVSWLDKQPDFAPDGFELKLSPGVALLPVEEVAKPIWEFLQWLINSAEAETPDDHSQLENLRTLFNSTQQSQSIELEAAHVTSEILRVIMDEARIKGWESDRKMSRHVPVVTEFDMPVLMFGGLSVDIGENDVRKIFDILIEQHRKEENEELARLVSFPSIYEYLQPYAHGYELAYQTRQALNIDPYTAFIDIHKHLEHLGISVLDTELETGSIRGVAIAGANFSPAIVVNTNHKFNGSARGRRFTLAHELCHILFDRSRAKRLSHISGPWTSGRVEKRANAFAALFLATPHALEKALRTAMNIDTGTVKRLASKFGIGTGALLEHLHNLDLISGDVFQSIRGYKYD